MELCDPIPRNRANDLSYGLLHEQNGRFSHFYKAKWESIQMNEIPEGLLRAEQ